MSEFFFIGAVSNFARIFWVKLSSSLASFTGLPLAHSRGKISLTVFRHSASDGTLVSKLSSSVLFASI